MTVGHAARLGLGLAALGRPGYINLGHGEALGEDRSPQALEARTHRVLDAARQGGVEHFDAARSYGRAEAFLASWLRARHVAPDELTVSSKWGYTYTADWRVDADVHEVKEHSLAVLRRQWGESRERLGDHLDLYQIHSVTADGGVLDDRPVLRELARLRHEGVRIGFTTSGPGQAEAIVRALRVRVDGEPLFEAVQATWNLLERSAAPALAEAQAAGWTVIVKEALANGRLAPGHADPAVEEAVRGGRAERDDGAASLDALALAAALARPWADVVLSGAATEAQLRSNLRAREVAWDERDDERTASIVESPEGYWERRKALRWS